MIEVTITIENRKGKVLITIPVETFSHSSPGKLAAFRPRNPITPLTLNLSEFGGGKIYSSAGIEICGVTVTNKFLMGVIPDYPSGEIEITWPDDLVTVC